MRVGSKFDAQLQDLTLIYTDIWCDDINRLRIERNKQLSSMPKWCWSNSFRSVKSFGKRNTGSLDRSDYLKMPSMASFLCGIAKACDHLEMKVVCWVGWLFDASSTTEECVIGIPLGFTRGMQPWFATCKGLDCLLCQWLHLRDFWVLGEIDGSWAALSLHAIKPIFGIAKCVLIARLIFEITD